jgi:signal transduction histidine kinase
MSEHSEPRESRDPDVLAMAGDADAMRAELVQLRQDLAQVQREFNATHAAQLLEANEQLVLAALQAGTIAESVMAKLSDLTRRTRMQGLPLSSAAIPVARAGIEIDIELPDDYGAPGGVRAPTSEARAQSISQRENDDLREANQQLVLTSLAASETEAKARLAQRQQSQRLAIVAHELRNPLAPIRTAADLLNRARADENLHLRLQATIKRQVAHMGRIIEDLLDSSRIDSGKFHLEFGTIDLCGVLIAAVDACAPAMDSRLQHMGMHLPDGPLALRADAVRLGQVFRNLLDNASKYTHDGGGITLTAVVMHQAVVVTVSDNGIGISSEALPHVFELFAQDVRAVATDSHGLGIGLAVVRELVEAHGGSVVATSAGYDLGSEFVVTLPMAVAAAVAVA